MSSNCFGLFILLQTTYLRRLIFVPNWFSACLTKTTQSRYEVKYEVVYVPLTVTFKDLAVKTLEELWFSSVGDVPLQASNISALSERGRLLSKVTVIMAVCGNFKDRQSPLDDVLHKIASVKDGAEANMLLARFGEIVEIMIDGLVDASDFPGFVSHEVVFVRLNLTFSTL